MFSFLFLSLHIILILLLLPFLLLLFSSFSPLCPFPPFSTSSFIFPSLVVSPSRPPFHIPRLFSSIFALLVFPFSFFFLMFFLNLFPFLLLSQSAIIPSTIILPVSTAIHPPPNSLPLRPSPFPPCPPPSGNSQGHYSCCCRGFVLLVISLL